MFCTPESPGPPLVHSFSMALLWSLSNTYGLVRIIPLYGAVAVEAAAYLRNGTYALLPEGSE